MTQSTTAFPFRQAVFLDLDSLHPADLNFDQLWRTAQHWEHYALTKQRDLLARVRYADLVISNKVVLDRPVLSRLSSLRLICIAATGTNNVDLDAAAEYGIPVCNVTGYATASVAEHTFALILALRRRLNEHQQAAGRQWPQETQFCVLDYPVAELRSKTLGIIGYGELGKAVAQRARAFGMQVIVSQRPGMPDERPDRLPLADVLAGSDVLSLHCPLTPATRHLIDAGALAKMKPDALLINTARGGIVDETALLEALNNSRLGGAALDVLEREPPPTDHPLLHSGLPSLIITPHVAWASRESRQRLVDELVKNIQAFSRGRERNRLA